jgi:hypothetical protein
MFVVAIHSTEPVDGSRAPALAAVLGGTAFDVRHRVLSAGPCVVAALPDGEAARALASRLEAAGFRTLVRDADAIVGASIWTTVRSFELSGAGLRVVPRQGSAFDVTWAAMRLLVRGTAVATETTVETVTEKKFSLGRAVASGGLMRNKKVKVEHSHTEQTREGFIHLYAAGVPVSVFGETTVEYTGLGEHMAATRTGNFVVLIERIRALAPGVGYDDRLQTRVGQSVVLGPTLDPARYLPVASALISAAAAVRGR